jgi:hypothetical protein
MLWLTASFAAATAATWERSPCSKEKTARHEVSYLVVLVHACRCLIDSHDDKVSI